jgi:hypothetical protein
MMPRVQRVPTQSPLIISPSNPASANVSVSDIAIQTRTTPAVEPQLSQEIASLDRARSALLRQAPDMALRELDSFGSGYRVLGSEVMMVRIDALVALGPTNSS